MSERTNILFIGTSDFGVPALETLINNENFTVNTVITQPDKPAGRQREFLPSPIKNRALKHGLGVLQPDKISSFKLKISELNPDIIIVIAYAQIISETILKIPRYGCINVHGSLLPKYRGAACIQAAILNGDKESGITIIEMDENLDTGPILAQQPLAIDAGDTTGTLHDKLAVMAPELLLKTLDRLISGKITPTPQDNSQASYVPKLKKSDGHIDWKNPAAKIERHIRAMSPWPGAFTYYTDSRKQTAVNRSIKILKADKTPININKYGIGELFLHEGELAIQCGCNALIIENLQFEGKKPAASKDFLRGHMDIIGQILI